MRVIVRTMRALSVLLLGVVLVAAGTSGAAAAPGRSQTVPEAALGIQAVSLPGASLYGYATPLVLTTKGLGVSYTNFDIVQHDFVQDVRADGFAGPKNRPWCKRFSKGKCPVFWSELAGLGKTVAVQGLSAVTAGRTYSFYCTIHLGMTGKLMVIA